MTQRRAPGLRSLEEQLEPLLDGGAGHDGAEAIGQMRLVGPEAGEPQPGVDERSSFLPQGNQALLPTFALQLDGAAPMPLHFLDLHAQNL